MEERTEWNLFSSRFMYCLTGIGWTEGADDLLHSAVRLTVCSSFKRLKTNDSFAASRIGILGGRAGVSLLG